MTVSSVLCVLSPSNSNNVFNVAIRGEKSGVSIFIKDFLVDFERFKKSLDTYQNYINGEFTTAKIENYLAIQAYAVYNDISKQLSDEVLGISVEKNTLIIIVN